MVNVDVSFPITLIRIAVSTEGLTYAGGILVVISTRNVRKVKNVCAYNPRSCFIVPDQSCGVFSRV